MPFPLLLRGRWLLAPALGALSTLGYAPYGQWYLPVLALALLFHLCAGLAPRRAALLGWTFGAAHYGTGVYWVYISTHIYGGAPAIAGVGLAAGLFSYLALFPALWLGLGARAGWLHRPQGWLGMPALGVLLELLRGWIYSGFPWLAYGELTLDTPVSRLAPLVGVPGLSAVVLLAAYALYRIGVEHQLRGRALAIAMLVLPVLTVLLPKPSFWTAAQGEPVAVALVQSNIPQDQKWLPQMRLEALSRHWRMTQQAWPADLVVWPEVALTQPLDQLQDGYLQSLQEQAAARSATLLVGIMVRETPEQYNSVVAVGAGSGRYDKRHLVPFGEYFPIPDFMRPLMDWMGTPYKDLSFGAQDQTPIQVGAHRVALSICFEDVFGDEIRRDAASSAFLVNMTNDAWFADSSAPHQHLQFSRLRAMENGRWLARTANTGISALIDADGVVVARTPQFTETVLRGTLQPRSGTTPYQRWGDTPSWIGALALLLGALLWRRLGVPAGSHPQR